MATRQTKSGGSSRSKGSSRGGSNKTSSGKKRSSSTSGGSRNGRVSAAQVARHAREQMRELTGHPVEGVLSVQRVEEGGWHVTVQVLELRRVPNSTDVLGAYLLSIDESGEVREYRRTRRYYRNQVEEE
jgi:hypothetical protein